MTNAGSLADKTPPSDFKKQKIVGFILAFPLLILTLAPLNALVLSYNIHLPELNQYLHGFELVVAVGFRAIFFAAIAMVVVFSP